MSTETLIEEEADVIEKQDVEDNREIVLYNDDFHTFDFVIESLIKVCEHTSIQAEQCTYIVHYNGKCGVKKGNMEKLKPICTALLDRGLTAEIV
jgi:ATP-dependent Clp protease adaptor protein ClpS